MNPTNFLFTTVILTFEYGLKQFFEDFSTANRHSKLIYLWYRIGYWISLTMILVILFQATGTWVLWPLISLFFTLLGSMEIVTEALNRGYSKIIKHKNYSFHLLSLGLITYFALVTVQRINCTPSRILQQFISFFQNNLLKLPISTNKIVITSAVMLLLAQPANYFIRWLISKQEDYLLPEILFYTQPPKVSKKVPHNSSWVETAVTIDNLAANAVNIHLIKTGRIIGILERWLILCLILCGQFAGIAFVLTAKSIARYHKFENQDFAEYYLIGTLYSSLLAIILGLICSNVR